ncbi:uncharacterized protein LOC110257391 [Sus scrofa]|uniref:uncharacterized protein LOC110257391 n=1 Tax=Sus scrofa TaxID=9823 RepID=UPI000A2B1444|nr:uncharacterized protein LOC110257391 [Sus scrofa]
MLGADPGGETLASQFVRASTEGPGLLEISKQAQTQAMGWQRSWAAGWPRLPTDLHPSLQEPEPIPPERCSNRGSGALQDGVRRVGPGRRRSRPQASTSAALPPALRVWSSVPLSWLHFPRVLPICRHPRTSAPSHTLGCISAVVPCGLLQPPRPCADEDPPPDGFAGPASAGAPFSPAGPGPALQGLSAPWECHVTAVVWEMWSGRAWL